jgi:hypothetical protein
MKFVLVTFSYLATCAWAGQASLLAASPAAVQDAHAQSGAPGIRADSNDARSITLDVVVTDKSGAPIKGLKGEDFTVLDNKQRQAISVVEAGGASQAGENAVEAYLLIDGINSHVSTVASERRDLTAYLEHAGRLPLPTSLVFLTPDGLKI